MTHFLITTGAESSGKTTLATQLADVLQAPLVSEASRDYLNALYSRQPGYQYREEELLAIARLQHEREQQALKASPPLIVCDTDLLVIIVWSEVKFGRVDPWITNTLLASLQQNPRSYFLCDPEIPWQADPLREHPQQRPMLFERYRAKLAQYQCRHAHVSGDEASRLQTSLKFFRSGT
ncbi:MAG: ATP-binding protein [Pseudomonadota bacterium]